MQHDAADCGVACLATLVRLFGGDASLEMLRERSGTGPNGTTMLGLSQAAADVGLKADGYEADLPSLLRLDVPSILHVSLPEGRQHFIVCFGEEDGRLMIGDPATGVRRVATDELELLWQSRALLAVRRTASFVPASVQAAARRRWLLDRVLEDRRPLLLALMLGVFISTFGLTLAVFSKELIDGILPNADTVKLAVGLALVALFLVVQNGLSAVRQLILLQQARNFNNRIVRDFLDALVRLPYSFFRSRKTGDLMARLNDTQSLQRTVTYVFGDAVINALLIMVAVTFTAVYSPAIAMWLILGVGLLGTSAWFHHRRIVAGHERVMAAHAVNQSTYVNCMQGIAAIKSSNAEGVFAHAMRTSFAFLQQAVFALGRVGLSFNLWAQSAGILVVVGVLGWGSILVLGDVLQLGTLVALLQVTNMLVPAAYGLALVNFDLQEASVAYDRMYRYSSLKPEYGPAERGKIARPHPFRRFRVEGLAVGFPGRLPLLENVSLEVALGELVVLLGKTGSGKSTLMHVLQRLLVPARGRITVDGRDWHEIPTPDWRELIGVVPQQVQIFGGTVMQNISMGPVELDDVVAFCQEAGLDEFFRRLPDQYMTRVGEGGVDLSGGQRQIVAIARALFRRPRFLLLDEPTAAMDGETALWILNLLEERKSEMGILTATHQSLYGAVADRVYVLGRGATVSATGA